MKRIRISIQIFDSNYHDLLFVILKIIVDRNTKWMFHFYTRINPSFKSPKILHDKKSLKHEKSCSVSADFMKKNPS